MQTAKKITPKLLHPRRTLIETSKELNNIRFALDESTIVAITDPAGKITFVNDKFCRISKYSKKELLGQDYRIVNSGHHSEKFMQSLWQTITQGNIWRGEIKNKAKDGNFYWVDTTIIPFLNVSGKPYQYIAVHYNITKQKEVEEALSASEKKFKDFFDNSPIGFHILDENQIIIDINKAELNTIGYSREEVVGVKKWKDLIIEEQRELYQRDWDELLKYGKIMNKEYTLLHKSGQHIHVLRNVKIKFDKPDSLVHIKGSVIDITEKKKLDEEIEELPQKIIAAQEIAQRVIAQEIHDDFGQQLIAFKIFFVNKTADLTEKYPELKEISDCLKIKINEIIDKARNLSHKLAPPDLKYIGLVKAVKELVNSMDIDKNFSINFTHRNLTNIDFETKDIILFRIIQEALVNIVKHAGAKNIHISLGHKQGRVHLRIKDDGKGFNVKEHNKSNKSLGISVMRQRAKLAGGVLHIKSAPGSGTQINLSIPVKMFFQKTKKE